VATSSRLWAATEQPQWCGRHTQKTAASASSEIDGNIAGNAHVGIDDKVVISKAKSNPAVKITLAPTQPVRIVGAGGLSHAIPRGASSAEGRDPPGRMLGNPITFVITATQPAASLSPGRALK